ncbi:uncharacterized protein LOC107360282 isoform X1 [Tetranychus urticae]|uniref:uncharacterized protein LOC107360282 isoform X1 n=1 Tax=Tetranychus urticae TaxID=32264 RepID=UPI00077BE0D8|nr:uncharacterized protein LOC107360282 isoform X1 [Tetranychus urticae]XP_025016292.1 uncharacterized protein LOC107360282 isoform X1 [Tetranychus urticae]
METIWNKCCLCVSLQKGVMGYGIISMLYYCMVVTGGTIWASSDNVFGFISLGFLVIFFCTLSILSSVLLIIGVCVESRRMFLPWIIVIPCTNGLTIIHTFVNNSMDNHLVDDDSQKGNVAFDFVILAIFAYGILCAILLHRKISSTKVSHQGKFILPVKQNNTILPEVTKNKSNSSPTLSKVTIDNSGAEPSSPATCHIFLGID